MFAAATLMALSCGSDEAAPTTSPTTSPTTAATTTVVSTTVAPTVAPPTVAPTTVAPTTVAPTTTIAGVAQPAIWPAADTVFTTPDAAASDFVQTVLGVSPLLGEFQAGDSRSGEIAVFSPGDGTPVERSILFLRMLGPSDGWFVIGAANPAVTISTPQTVDEVTAGPVTVGGVARGFESTVLVRAFVAGRVTPLLDEVITAGGAFATSEPYSVSVDLSGAAPGDVVTLLVRGDTGLDGDPGEFSAVPIVVR
jgi:hypothetical protein